jgi:hypothetical protein
MPLNVTVDDERNPVPLIVSVWGAAPAASEDGFRPDIVGTGLLEGALTLAEADPTLPSKRLVAVIVCVPLVDGAVYKPDEEMTPTLELPPVIPSTAHDTPQLGPTPKTEALNCT